jgi:hypothetical protein
MYCEDKPNVSDHPLIFADALQEANVVHNVVRLRLGQVGAGGKLNTAGTLVVPLQQLPGLARAVTSLVDQLESRSRPAEG